MKKIFIDKRRHLIRQSFSLFKFKQFYILKMISVMFMLGALFNFLGCASSGNKSGETLKPVEPAVITSIDIQDHAMIITASKPFIYTIYKPGDPYKLIIDLPDVSAGTFTKKIVARKSGITEVSPSQITTPSPLTRIEMLMQSPYSYEQEYKNNVLTVKIKEETPAVKAEPLSDVKVTELIQEQKKPVPVVEKVPDMPSVPSVPLPDATEINNISFDQYGRVVRVKIKGNGSMVPNVFPLENRIVIDIPNVKLNAAIPSEVMSPVKGIRSGRYDDKVRLVLDLQEDTNFDVASISDSIIISLRGRGEEIPTAQMTRNILAETESAEPVSAPVKVPEALAGSKCQSYLEGKENVNFDFQDQDIVPILRLFADISNCNLFLHPEVKGKATMKFRDVPWNQALDTILKTFSLDKSVEGNVIRIAPNTVFTREKEEKVKLQEAQVKAEPLEQRIYPVSYADVGIVESAIKKVLTPRGSINVDKRTSTMVVKDVATVFPEVENLLKTLDKPTPQVLIEARIVEVNTNSERELGIQWGVNLKTTNTLASIGGLSGVPLLSTGPFTGGNYLVDFPAKGVGPLSGSGFTFGIIDPARSIGLDLQLSAIETMGHLKVISNPKVLTIDNGKAKILQGKSIPVRKLTTEGTVSTEFKDVTLELNVTPHITPDRSISMSVEIKKEELDPTVPSVEGVPGTDKKEANTNVIIKDGETIVIGGMYKVTTNDSESGVPGLMKIPILGWLFKSNKVSSNTSELLIFITPRILDKQ